MSVLIVGAGSCIIEAVLKHFRSIPGLDERAELHLSQILPGGRSPVPADLLARTGILIEEAAPWQGSGTLTAEERAGLPSSCTTITVPTLHFNSLWPLMVEDPRNVPEPGAPYGRIPFGMGDRLALKVMQSVADPAARRAAYEATDLATVVNLARSHELEVRNCFAREQGCDVRVAGYVMSHFREKRLYYTHNHPTGELMYFVLAQLFAVPIDDLPGGSGHAALLQETDVIVVRDEADLLAFLLLRHRQPVMLRQFSHPALLKSTHRKEGA